MEVVSILVMVGILVALALIQRALHALHLSLNSRLDKLLDTTRALALKEGFAAGQEDIKNLAALKSASSDLLRE